jgi:hypothetical protein
VRRRHRRANLGKAPFERLANFPGAPCLSIEADSEKLRGDSGSNSIQMIKRDAREKL